MEEFIRTSKCIKAVQMLKELQNSFYQDVSINENFMEREEVYYPYKVNNQNSNIFYFALF